MNPYFPRGFDAAFAKLLWPFVLLRFELQAGGAKENVSVLVIRLNTDRGPSLARLRPTRQVMSIDDVEAAMAHDAALKAQRAARAEREAAVAALTSTATATRPAAVHDTSQSGSTVDGGTVAGLGGTNSSLSGYTARMSFTSSDAGGNTDEATPRNSSDALSTTAANSTMLSPSSRSTVTPSSSVSTSSSGQTLRLNFSPTDDDDDELMRQLIKRASQLSTVRNDDEEDVGVDDRFVRDIIRAELPPPPASLSPTADVAASSVQRQTRRRHRQTSVEHDQAPITANSSMTHQRPHFVKKSSSGVQAAAELGGPKSLRRNHTSPVDAVNTTSQPFRRFASSLPRSPVDLSHDANVLTSPPQLSVAEASSSKASQSPVTFGRRSPPPASHRKPTWKSTPSPKPSCSAVSELFGDDKVYEHGDTQYFVEVARF